MKILDYSGLKYYTLKLITKIKNWIIGFTPTVHVRPAQKVRVDTGYVLGIGEQRVGEDIQEIAGEIYVYSDKFHFSIICDSKESADLLCNSGEYSLRVSYLSRTYGSPKWVCPSLLNDFTNNPNWSEGTVWESIPLVPEDRMEGTSTISVDRDILCRDLMLEMVTSDWWKMSNTNPDLYQLENDDPDFYQDYIHPFLLENALIFGSHVWKIWSPRVIRKNILFKGVIPYLKETNLDITQETIRNTPTNAYTIPVKISIWKGRLELPGGSTGVLSFHKKQNGLDIECVYKYKETKKYY